MTVSIRETGPRMATTFQSAVSQTSTAPSAADINHYVRAHADLTGDIEI
jgi:hypothetical protein